MTSHILAVAPHFVAKRAARYECARTLLRIEAHLRHTAADHAEFARGRATDIDDPTAPERATVIDAHDHGAAVFQVRHTNLCSKRQRTMRGGKFRCADPLAAGGAPAVIVGGIPGFAAGLADDRRAEASNRNYKGNAARAYQN